MSDEPENPRAVAGDNSENAGLANYAARVIALESRFHLAHHAQMNLLRAAASLYWQTGWRGKDGRRLPNPVNRFIARIGTNPGSLCWTWCGAVTARGYGLFPFNGKQVLAHRWSFGITKGLSGGRMVVDHLCRNTRCVNHLHLEEVSQSVNVLRGRGPELTAQRQRSKTMCAHGHHLSGDNVYFSPAGSRSCRVCNRRRKLIWQQKNRGR